jgi:hypothetical protein
MATESTRKSFAADIQLIANQLGHSTTRIAEEHYAHFSPSYVAATIRENKPNDRLNSGQ